MFTGLIETIGTLTSVSPLSQGRRFLIEAPGYVDGVQIGESIAVNGLCLTVTTHTGSGVTFDVSRESVSRSTLGSWTVGRKINLERALQLTSRLGGHIVQGHVDGTGALVERQDLGEIVIFRFTAPEAVLRYTIEKGSIAIDGVSLTVNTLHKDSFEVGLIPHTCQVTTLGTLRPGDQVNLEADVLGKYVERLLKGFAGKEGASSLSEEWIRIKGFEGEGK